MTVLAINKKANTFSFAIILATMPFDPNQIDLSVALVHLGAPCTLSKKLDTEITNKIYQCLPDYSFQCGFSKKMLH